MMSTNCILWWVPSSMKALLSVEALDSAGTADAKAVIQAAVIKYKLMQSVLSTMQSADSPQLQCRSLSSTCIMGRMGSPAYR